MPPEGLDWLPKPEVLTGDEVARLVRIGVERLGIREVRFTGGEPLLRRDLVSIIAVTAALSPRPEISLTTNGIGLDRRAAALRDAGLDRINVSLDTLRPEVFRKLSHRDRLSDVLTGLAAAAAAGLTPVKVNTRRPTCCATAWSTATSCGSSSRCRSTRNTAGSAPR
jgi:cyclic pyranopterin phosphate synthase